jgi:hypothetical protein
MSNGTGAMEGVFPIRKGSRQRSKSAAGLLRADRRIPAGRRDE